MGQAQSQRCNASKQKNSLSPSSPQANDGKIMKTFVESRGGGNDDDDDDDDDDTSKKKSLKTKKSRIKKKHSKCSSRNVNNSNNNSNHHNGKGGHLLKNDVELIVRKKLITTTTTLQPLSELAKQQQQLDALCSSSSKRESQKRTSLKTNKASPPSDASDVLNSKDELNYSDMRKCSSGECCQSDCDAIRLGFFRKKFFNLRLAVVDTRMMQVH
jgi:hypothetical protein